MTYMVVIYSLTSPKQHWQLYKYQLCMQIYFACQNRQRNVAWRTLVRNKLSHPKLQNQQSLPWLISLYFYSLINLEFKANVCLSLCRCEENFEVKS